jgi:hypothetical protein
MKHPSALKIKRNTNQLMVYTTYELNIYRYTEPRRFLYDWVKSPQFTTVMNLSSLSKMLGVTTAYTSQLARNTRYNFSLHMAKNISNLLRLSKKERKYFQLISYFTRKLAFDLDSDFKLEIINRYRPAKYRKYV